MWPWKKQRANGAMSDKELDQLEQLADSLDRHTRTVEERLAMLEVQVSVAKRNG